MYVNLQKIENSATTPCRCATLEKENEMLKEQIAHMKERITDLEKENATNVKDSEKIEKEIKILAKLSKLDLKGSLEKLDELDKMIPSTVFSSIASNVKEQCPVISSLLETLAVGRHTSRNYGKNEDYKFKCALQVLSAINEIRSQKSDSDLSTLFGLLLIANGAGKGIIQFLHPFGLTKSYSF